MKKIILIILSAVLFLANLSYASVERQQMINVLSAINKILIAKSGDPGAIVCQSVVTENWLKPLSLPSFYGDSDVLKLAESKINLIRSANQFIKENINLKTKVINFIEKNELFRPPTDLSLSNFETYFNKFSMAFNECRSATEIDEITNEIDSSQQALATAKKKYNLIDLQKKKATMYLNYQELKMYLENGYSIQ